MWGLFAIIWLLLFSDFSKGPIVVAEKVDPYVLSTKGKTLVIRDKLITVEENQQELIFVWDKIKTLDSTATIFWPDGSITRLGEKTSIKINEIHARTANEDIQIDFSLEEGKTWSNVVKYMFGDSYFHERFNNNTSLAAVRGTVFEVNLDRKYIHTIDHAISVEDIQSHTGSVFVVAGWVFDTDTRKAIIREKIDETWNKINNDADLIYLNERLENLNKQILGITGKTNYMDIVLRKIGLKKTDSSLQSLLENEIRTTSNSGRLMDLYQSIYGLRNTSELLDTKMKLRDVIVKTAATDKKKAFLDDFARSTIYDSWNVVKLGTGSIESLQLKLNDYIKQGADQNLINSLKNAAKQENLQNLNKTLEDMKQTIIKTIGEKNILEEAKKEITPESLQKINDAADSIRNSFSDEFDKLFQ